MSKKTIGSRLRFTSLVMIICLLLGGVAGFELWIIRKNKKAEREKTLTTAKEQVGPLTGDMGQESGNNVAPTLEPWDHAYWWEYGLTEEDIHERWWWKENPTMNESEIMYYLQNEERLDEERRNMQAQDIYRPRSLYEQAYERATNEQRKMLESIIVVDNTPAVWESSYVKRIKMIMGDLPADTPYISLKQVEDICARVDKSKSYSDAVKWILSEMDRIAGAPDIDGGSGFRIFWYYTDETYSAHIQVHCGDPWGRMVSYSDATGASYNILIWGQENDTGK